ncbi:hypothetical protein ACQ858_19710 [Variovorax ureilyticus]|uniref:hypothetical protein n=1 Tax=Variovorax ureilyticus TaxID=1836198 RepID=UPI003D67E483
MSANSKIGQPISDAEAHAIHSMPYVRDCLLAYHERPEDVTADAVVKAIAVQVQALSVPPASKLPAAQGIEPSEEFDGYLCRAWGETDHTVASIVASMDGVRQFIIDQWLGDKDAPDLPEIMVNVSDEIEDKGEYRVTFEIGGVSVEPVFAAAISPAPAAPRVRVEALREAYRPLALDQEWTEHHSRNYPKKAAAIINAARSLLTLSAPGPDAAEHVCFHALCQNCLHIQRYPSEADMLDAHQERTRCEKCDGQMCACDGCLRAAKAIGDANEILAAADLPLYGEPAKVPQQGVIASAAPATQPVEQKPIATLHDDGYWTWNNAVADSSLRAESTRAGWRMPVYAAPKGAAVEAATEYTGARCVCLQTGCRAGPGCPHYSQHCKAHIEFTHSQAAAKVDA